MLLLEMRVGNEWRNIRLLRESVKNCSQAAYSSGETGETGETGDAGDALAMVASELLENAIKYGAFGGPDAHPIQLRVHGHDSEVEVEVQSPIDPECEGPEKLMAVMDWLDSFDSPEEAYMTRLNEIATAAREGPEAADIGQLGLVRIAYEGGCTLAAEVDRGRRTLSVTATLRR